VRHLDKLENESRPSATIDKNVIEFGEVKFASPCVRTLILENTGKVAAKFQFIPKFEEKRYCKPWMSIQPPFGILSPSEKITIKLTVHIDHATALEFNLGNEKLEDILILHLNGGLDYFVRYKRIYHD
jgi:phosphatidylinositol-bisphosphatase